MRGRAAAALLTVALARPASVALAEGNAAGGRGADASPSEAGRDAGAAGALPEARDASEGPPSSWPPGTPPGTPASPEDKDLGLIPRELREASPPSGPAFPPSPALSSRSLLEKKLFLENALTLVSPSRRVVVPYPGTPPGWQNRTSFDLYVRGEPGRGVTITLSNRLNVIVQEEVAFWSRQTLRNDLREGYVTWEVFPSAYLEAGRINLRHGAALGFNPTDFFKTRTLVGQPSLDPSALRQNRLGTLLARAQKIWDAGSASIAYAPKVQAPSPIVRADRWGADPAFDATNGAERALAVLGLDLGDLSAQLLGYYEARRAKIGCNLSRAFGDAVIAYAEWAGGWEQNLIARGFAYGQATGTLPADAALLPPTDPATALRNDLAAGGSWTIARQITLNLEYHFHQSGFGRDDWRSWFDLGSAPTSSSAVAGELWYLRGYAADQQEPATRHELFVRAGWPRVFTSRLELSGFALVDLLDASTLAQVAASFYPSDAWTLALYGALNTGAARSERGSLPRWGSVVLQVVRYL